jgi:hypothetical protein
METARFRKWLVEQGCRFEHQRRRQVQVVVTVHRGN